MKQILFKIVFLFLSFWATAQSNHFFIDHARWVYQTKESYEPGQIFMYSGLEENTILGDTILDGMHYKKLYKRYIHNNSTKPPHPSQGTSTISYENKGPFYIRYDTVPNKVFYKENADSSEVLIYNFNLGIGESIVLRKDYFNSNNVLRIDSVNIFGKNHGLLIVDTSVMPFHSGIIEGIGGLNGLTYNQPSFTAVSGGILMTDLLCFEHGDRMYFSPWASHFQLPCPSLDDFISSTNPIIQDIVKVYPNPNNGSFEFQIPNELIGFNLKIYNETGSVVYTTKITQNRIEVKNQSSGLYFWHIPSSSKKIIHGKILVNRF